MARKPRSLFTTTSRRGSFPNDSVRPSGIRTLTGNLAATSLRATRGGSAADSLPPENMLRIDTRS